MAWNNALGWLFGSARNREQTETRATWEEVEGLWRSSPFAGERAIFKLSLAMGTNAVDRFGRRPASPIIVELCMAAHQLLEAEELQAIEPNWPLIDADVSVAVRFRTMLTRRRRWTADTAHMLEVVQARFDAVTAAFLSACPESCFGGWSEDEGVFGVRLVDLLERPAEALERFIVSAYDDDIFRYDLLERLRSQYGHNILVASGFSPDDDPNARMERLVMPSRQKAKGAAELVDQYLAGTPFRPLFDLQVPFRIPEEARFEHCHIVGGTGHGKTQLMQRMIHADLVAAQRERRSVIVIDSQGDLINKLVRLALFSPEEPDSLADRLVLIDPADVEFPAALNLFDAHLSRLRGYGPADRERVLNGVIELYELFFGALLGAELTQKQGVVFKYLARLMLSIEGATIHTLMQLMADGKPFKAQMAALDGSARHFFETEFFDPSFSATKKQILRRLWGVLSTPAFERMFGQVENKVDLFEAMNGGKIVLISTAKDLLKAEGSALLGRFFIALIAQAALERSTIPERERTPVMVYVDEAQEYFDDTIEMILSQARKYRVGLTLAHQALDQLSPRLRAALLSNTSVKCVGGVSAKDARALADELRTTPDFIESMRRHRRRTEFAVWVKHRTPSAIRLAAPLGFLEEQPLSTEEALAALVAQNRERYCGKAEGALRPMPAGALQGAGSQANLLHSDEGLRPLPPRRRQKRQEPVTPAPSPTLRAGSPSVRLPPEKREMGKGGPQHRYAQYLIKGMAEERGFRAVIEEPVEGGQVDVALHRDGLSIACEVSMTSTTDHEARNIAKCLRAGFSRVWAIAPDGKRRRVIENAARLLICQADIERVEFCTIEDMHTMLEALPAHEPVETRVRGYAVKVSRTSVSPSEARERRATIARTIAKSVRRQTDAE